MRVAAALQPWKRRREVELDLRAERLVGCVDQVVDVLVVGTADVVDPDVEPAELGDRPVGDGLGQVADVAVDDQARGRGRGYAIGRDLEIVDPAGIDDDVASGVGERPARCRARCPGPSR